MLEFNKFKSKIDLGDIKIDVSRLRYVSRSDIEELVKLLCLKVMNLSSNFDKEFILNNVISMSPLLSIKEKEEIAHTVDLDSKLHEGRVIKYVDYENCVNISERGDNNYNLVKSIPSLFNDTNEFIKFFNNTFENTDLSKMVDTDIEALYIVYNSYCSDTKLLKEFGEQVYPAIKSSGVVLMTIDEVREFISNLDEEGAKDVFNTLLEEAPEYINLLNAVNQEHDFHKSDFELIDNTTLCALISLYNKIVKEKGMKENE